MTDVFISYAREDRAIAELLANKLIEQGWSVWWDSNIPLGKPFDGVIEEALNSSKCVVVLWSKNSVASNWVKAEAAEGAERGVLVPVLIEDVKIPLEFRRIQTANLSNWKGTSSQPAFKELLSTIAKYRNDENKNITRHGSVVEESSPEQWWGTSSGIRVITASGIIAIIGLILAIYLVKIREQKEEFVSKEPDKLSVQIEAAGSSAKAGADANTPAIVDGPRLLSANALYRDFQNNPIDAGNKYVGKTVVLEGLRGDIVSPSDSVSAAVHIADSGRPNALILSFPDRNDLAGINRGQKFRFRCTVEEYKYFIVWMKDCTIERR